MARHILGIVEQVVWVDVNVDMPDSEITVLVNFPKSESEPVWLGYFCSESEEWRSIDHFPFTEMVTHWAEMLRGTQS